MSARTMRPPRLGDALAAPDLARSRAATGRVNLVAQAAGLLRVDAARIDRLNAVDEALTVATLPDLTPVAPRDMVATIKVIPFAVPERGSRRSRRSRAEARRCGCTVPRRWRRPGADRTAGPQGKRHREHHRGHPGTHRRPDRTPAAAAALPARRRADRRRAGERCSRRAPSAADRRRLRGGRPPRCRARRDRAGGGEIPHFGMPVDPGNLICLGRIGAGPALRAAGLRAQPAAERHRLGAAAPLCRACRWAGAEVMRMGVGGLLKESEVAPAAARRRRRRARPRRASAASRWSSWPPAGPAAWRRTTSCWSRTAPGSR